MMFRTRFAPSPTGPLHLGHAYSAILAYDMAKRLGGEFLLRIEDIDQSRARASWTQMIYDDLEWLGLEWSEPVMVQSTRHCVYQERLDTLWRRGFLYVCHCNRKDILAAVSAPQEGSPMIGPDGVIYPGTCRGLVNDIVNPRPQDAALRLTLCGEPNQNYTFNEVGEGPGGETGLIISTRAQMITEVGDIILSRKDMGTSYHLSVVLDDAAQGITHVVRGHDLFEATKIHVLLQDLFGLQTPIYLHHDLIRNDQGKRLAKRDDARAIAKFRDEGYTANDIRKLAGLPC